MGAIAEAFVTYAQPLLDQTDGSEEQMNRAFAMGQLCYNLALTPKDDREEFIGKMRLDLDMDEEEFDDFRRSVLIPMIQRHEEMFPQMHRKNSQDDLWPRGPSFQTDQAAAQREAYPGTRRYAPCPCDSGKKYKFCCGKKRR